MIRIGKPYIEKKEDGWYIFCNILEDGTEKRLYWGGVADEYKDVLLFERADAILIGVLPYAMRFNHDIVCEAPVSEKLLYNIKEILAPALLRWHGMLNKIDIEADIAIEPLANAGMVGASLSCGVDSF